MGFLEYIICFQLSSAIGLYVYIIYNSHCEDIIKQFYTDYLQNRIHSFAFKAITNYSYTKNVTYKLANYIYNYHPIITNSTDITNYGFHFLYAMYFDENIEPYHKFWISSNLLIQSNFNHTDDINYNIITNYDFIYDYNSLARKYMFIRFLNNYYILLSYSKFNTLCNQKLLYANYNNIYISRVITNNQNLSTDISKNLFNHVSYFFQPSKVQFLSVTLTITSPVRAKVDIDIDIDTNLMYINNELFSTAFLLRYIHYNNIDINLNNNYVLDIMDNDINMIQIKPNEYLVLNNTDYTIKRV